jgi:lipopolysaccharide transport system ATP-binding protein
MSEPLVKVENVSKKFCRDLKRSLWYGVKDIGAELFGGKNGGVDIRKDEFWAVKDVSFELNRGECLGLIGHNGAGKSTLLKMLNGLIKPDRGIITMKGRVGALIELGAGFNPLLTGRENVFINGQVLGFTKKEIEHKFDEIIDFAEIREFLDMPVQNYSSGMKVRLGFAVACQMEPDIFLIDEVLAVGDLSFVLKCFNKMDSLLKNTAMIFVSHNIPQVARMSTRLLLLNKGQCIYNSIDIPGGLSKYYGSHNNVVGNFEGNRKVEVIDIQLSSDNKKAALSETLSVEYGKELKILITLRSSEIIKNPELWLAFYDKEQRVFAEVRNFNNCLNVDEIHGVVSFSACIPSIQFAQGVYSITIGLFNLEDGRRQTLFRFQSAVYFNVNGEHHGWAPVQLAPTWVVED